MSHKDKIFTKLVLQNVLWYPLRGCAKNIIKRTVYLRGRNISSPEYNTGISEWRKWVRCALFLYSQKPRVWNITIPSARIYLGFWLCWHRVLSLGQQGRAEEKFGGDWFDKTTLIFCFQILLGFVLLQDCLEDSTQRQVARDRFPGGLLSEQLYLNYSICHIRLALHAEL